MSLCREDCGPEMERCIKCGKAWTYATRLGNKCFIAGRIGKTTIEKQLYKILPAQYSTSHGVRQLLEDLVIIKLWSLSRM